MAASSSTMEGDVAARVAALREAESAGQQLEAKLSVARTLLSSASTRLGNTVDNAE